MPDQAQMGRKAALHAERTAKAQLVAGRLRDVFDNCGGVGKIADLTGISLKTLHNYVAKTNPVSPKFSDLAIIAEHAKASLDWIAGHHLYDPTAGTGGLLLAATTLDQAEFTCPPRYVGGQNVGSGASTVGAKQPIIAFRTDWLRGIGVQPQFAEFLIAIGDLMEPTIRDGDLVLIDRSISRAVDNGIYVLTLGGLALLKRLQTRRDGGVILKSDNPVYDDEPVPAGEVADLKIEGRVRWFGRTL